MGTEHKTAGEWAEEIATSCLAYYTGTQKNCDTGELKPAALLEFCEKEAGKIIKQAMAEAREEGARRMQAAAADECSRHAEFLHKEAHSGGTYLELITRKGEASYNAQRIRALDPRTVAEGGE